MIDPMLIKSIRNNQSTLKIIALKELELEDVQLLVKLLKTNTQVTCLKINESCLGPEDTKALADLLLHNKTLTTLNLTHNNMESEALWYLVSGLKTNKTLKELNISNNNLGLEGIQYIAEVLKVNDSLETLSLERVQLEYEGIKCLAEVLKTNPSISNLSLAGNNFGIAGADNLGEALKINKNLTILNLDNTFLGAMELKLLANALKTNNTLLNLSLAYNKFGAEGIEYLSEALKINHTLTNLNLASNGLGPWSAEFLANFLTVNKTLKVLNLSCNRFRQEGFKYLAVGLKYNTGLTILRIDDLNVYNSPNSKARIIFKALKNNTTLTNFIYTQDNIHGVEITQELKALLERNQKIVAIATDLTNTINSLAIDVNITFAALWDLQRDIEAKIADIKKLHAKATQLSELNSLWQQKQMQIAIPLLNLFKDCLSSLNCSINFAPIFADLTFLPALAKIQELATIELKNSKPKFLNFFCNTQVDKQLPSALKEIYLRLKDLAIKDGFNSNLTRQMYVINISIREMEKERKVEDNLSLCNLVSL